jgi:Rhodanese-like domain
MALLAIGTLLVLGLIVWALTRTVEPSATGRIASDTTGTSALPIDTATAPATPIASSTAGIATSSHAPVIAGNKKEVPRISAEDLKEKYNTGKVLIVDVRDQGSYDANHIKGALHIPLASIEANLDLLPKEKEIVTYCT